jgi:Tol biopolymer transport system component
MKSSVRLATISTSAALCAALFLTVPGFSQSEAEKAKARADQKAKAIAQARLNNTQILTLYDRQGKAVATLTERQFYNQPTISPDNTRVAVVQAEPEKETADIWVRDIGTGKAARITSSNARENTRAPVWSPDGKQLAYVALRGGSEGLYRKASDGQGPEEQLYKHPGFGLNLMVWSVDGKYLSFFTTDLSGGILYVLPLDGQGERKPIEVFRSASQVQGARLSPDNRFISYMSNESGRAEMYVRPFDATGKNAAPAGGPWKISPDGGQGMGFWRRDGKEFYYLAADRGFMAVEVSTSPAFEYGKPRLLFRLPEAVGVEPGNTSVSPDGQRFIVGSLPAPMLQQMTIFDRQGKVLSKVGEPGRYVQPHLSPDGTRIVALRNDPKTGQNDVWTYEVATGKGYPITNDVEGQNAPIWSPDGKQVAYVQTSLKGGLSSIYKKAWDGTGAAEQIFTYTPGAGMVLTDWSSDNKFMTFFTGVVVLVPLQTGTAADRKAIDWLREEYDVAQGRFSPDMKHIAYLSLESEVRPEVMVRKFDGTKPEADAKEKAVQVSKDGTMGMIAWRGDGKELYFLQPDLLAGEALIMAADVITTPEFKAGAPKLLFKLKAPLPGNSAQWKGASSDGQKFVFSINVAAN